MDTGATYRPRRWAPSAPVAPSPTPAASSSSSSFSSSSSSAASSALPAAPAVDGVFPGVVSQATGSAYLERAGVKVIAAVYGPRQAPKGTGSSEHGVLSCEVEFAPFALDTRRRHRRSTPEEQRLSAGLLEALGVCVQLSDLPKQEVRILVCVLERASASSSSSSAASSSPGSFGPAPAEEEAVLAACITCASVALADSGLPMFDIVTARHATLVPGRGPVDSADASVTPAGPAIGSASASSSASTSTSAAPPPSLTLALMPTLGQVTLFQQAGRVALPEATHLTEFLLERCKAAAAPIRETLRSRLIARLEQASRAAQALADFDLAQHEPAGGGASATSARRGVKGEAQ